MRETNYSFMQKNVNKPLNSNDTDQLIIFVYQTALSYVDHKYNSNGKGLKKDVTNENLAIQISASFFEDDLGRARLCSEHFDKMKSFDDPVDFRYYIFKTIHKKVDQAFEI